MEKSNVLLLVPVMLVLFSLTGIFVGTLAEHHRNAPPEETLRWSMFYIMLLPTLVGGVIFGILAIY
jgi:hypothetical protein